MREKYTNIPHVEMGGPVLLFGIDHVCFIMENLQLNMYVNRETALF